ncbi:hypothetical protein [Streptomyces sp. NPDC048496]
MFALVFGHFPGEEFSSVEHSLSAVHVDVQVVDVDTAHIHHHV